jgi:REP element-mobilizing transposase RayT
MPVAVPGFALLITWTCYGTWLPGDRRGYVSNTLRKDGTFAPKQNERGTQFTVDDHPTWQNAKQLQKYPSAKLDMLTADQAAQAMLAACEARDWRILRAALMWNHVHVVIGSCPDQGSDIRRVLKGVSQSELNRGKSQPIRWWTAGGSDRYLHGEPAIQRAINYVANQNGKLAEIIDNNIHFPEAIEKTAASERRGLSPP